MYQAPRLLMVMLFVLAGGALAACGDEDDNEQSPSLDVAIEQPTGTFILKTVERDDRFPPGCEGDDCWMVREDGREMLVLWVTPPDAVNISGAVTATGDAYVVAGDGQRYAVESNGMLNNRVYMAFAVPPDAQDFTLHWGDGEPVKLGM